MSRHYMEVVSIELVSETFDYVYDLDTEDGTFVVYDKIDSKGILCKNTDSCYIHFNIDKEPFTREDGSLDDVLYMKENFRIAQECADKISQEFKRPIELEFEKVMFPFFLYKKKRYAYKEWTRPDKPNHIEYKGISVVRRDYCKYVKNVLIGNFDILMNEYDKEKAYNFTRSSIEDLLLKEIIPIDDLVLTKSLKNQYKIRINNQTIETNWKNGICSIHMCQKEQGQPCLKCDICNNKKGIQQFIKTVKKDEGSKECKNCAKNYVLNNGPHVYVANKLRFLDPVNGPKPPDRVPFLITYDPNWRKLKQYQLAEHKDYMKDKKINYMYYFENQLNKSLIQMFEPMMENPEKIYKDIVLKAMNKYNGQSTLLNSPGFSFEKKDNKIVKEEESDSDSD